MNDHPAPNQSLSFPSSIPNLIQNGDDSTNDTNSISSLLRNIYIDQSIVVVFLGRRTLCYKTNIANSQA
ncbi:MAG: hypothetical protein ACI8RD_014582, partial [Bacillariaceae sp.]